MVVYSLVECWIWLEWGGILFSSESKSRYKVLFSTNKTRRKVGWIFFRVYLWLWLSELNETFILCILSTCKIEQIGKRRLQKKIECNEMMMIMAMTAVNCSVVCFNQSQTCVLSILIGIKRGVKNIMWIGI